MVCASCGRMFLFASIMFRLQAGRSSVSCPACNGGELREATPEELAAVVPAPTEWSRLATKLLWLVAALGVAFLAYVLIITEGGAY